MIIKTNSTSNIIEFFIEDASSLNKSGLSGLTPGDISCVYYRDTALSATSVTLTSMFIGDWTFSTPDYGFVEISGMSGIYQFSIPDAAVISGSKFVTFQFTGPANMVPVIIKIELVGYDKTDSMRLGLGSLPNQFFANAGGLPMGDNSGRVLLQPILHSSAVIYQVQEVVEIVNDVNISDSATLKIWDYSERELTSGDNIVLTKNNPTPGGGSVLGLNDLSIPDIETAVLNALDTEILPIPTADSYGSMLYTLHTNYTPARALYLDELASGNIPADIDFLKTQIGTAGNGLTDLPISNFSGDFASAVWSKLYTDTPPPNSYGEIILGLNPQNFVDAINAEGVVVKGFKSDVVTSLDPLASKKLSKQTYTFTMVTSQGNYIYSISVDDTLRFSVRDIQTPYGPYNIGQELPEVVQQDIESSMVLVKNNFLDPGLV